MYSKFKLVNLEEKRCHLWIYGRTNTGKSYPLECMIEEGIQVYIGPKNNDWFGFNPDIHEIIWFDEFKGQLTIQEMSALCDKHTQLNIKGTSYTKSKKVLVVVCSNYSISQCYDKALEKDSHAVDPLLARFRQMEMKIKFIPDAY